MKITVRTFLFTKWNMDVDSGHGCKDMKVSEAFIISFLSHKYQRINNINKISHYQLIAYIADRYIKK